MLGFLRAYICTNGGKESVRMGDTLGHRHLGFRFRCVSIDLSRVEYAYPRVKSRREVDRASSSSVSAALFAFPKYDRGSLLLYDLSTTLLPLLVGSPFAKS